MVRIHLRAQEERMTIYKFEFEGEMTAEQAGSLFTEIEMFRIMNSLTMDGGYKPVHWDSPPIDDEIDESKLIVAKDGHYSVNRWD